MTEPIPSQNLKWISYGLIVLAFLLLPAASLLPESAGPNGWRTVVFNGTLGLGLVGRGEAGRRQGYLPYRTRATREESPVLFRFLLLLWYGVGAFNFYVVGLVLAG